MSVNDVMLSLQLEIEQHLGEIEKIIARYGLPLSKITLIARDPDNNRKIIVLSNETESGLRLACQLAPEQSKMEYGEEE